MIFFTGVSRSGKTSTLNSFVTAHNEWRHVIASDVLRRLGRPLQGLNYESALKNQEELVDELSREGVLDGTLYLLDGHAVLDFDPEPLKLPDHFFDRLKPRGIVSFWDNPDSILQRHGQRAEPHLTLQRVEALQDLELGHSQYQAKRMEIEFTALRSGDVGSLREWLKQF